MIFQRLIGAALVLASFDLITIYTVNHPDTVPVSYAIGYCLLEDENFRDAADRMMYADKRRKKQQDTHRGH